MDALKELWPYISPHRSAALVSIGCITIGAIINVIIPLMLRDLSEKENISVTTYTFQILGLFFVYHVSSCYGHYKAAVVGRSVDTSLSGAAFDRWNNSPFSIAMSKSPEVVGAQVMQGAKHTGDCISGALTDLYQSIIFLVCFTFALLHTSPQLCIILAIIAGLNKVVTSHLSSDLTSLSEEVQKRQSQALKYLIHGGLYQSTIRLFHLQAETSKQFRGHLEGLREASREVDWKVHSSSGAMFGFNNFLYVLLIAAARHYKDEGHMTTGDILIFFFYVKRWLDHIGDIGKEVGKIRVVVGLTEGLRELLRCPADPKGDVVGKATAEKMALAVSLQDVAYTYGVRGISLQLEQGSLYGVVGRSGEGKTTLMRLMTSLLHPTEGTLERSSSVTLCEQDAGILSGTIWDNIAQGKVNASDEEVRRAASRAAFDSVVSGLKDGYKTQLRCEGEVPLSGGQIQRLCLARAMISDAKILIFDEPTKGLDPASSSRVMASLQEFVKEGRTVVLVTHSMSLVTNAKRIFFDQRGKGCPRRNHERHGDLTTFQRISYGN
eukprot:PhF_6_TR12296/c0_g1_i2/m.19524/K06147/ABCB-BAC; ATP-binding cassette, subfamily B, bacterial